MIDNVAKHTLELLKRMDANADRMLDDLADKAGFDESEIANSEGSPVGASVKDDRVETRLDHKEERLDSPE